MRYVELLFDIPLKQTFTYLAPVEESAGETYIGRRAIAPFGRQELVGYIIGEKDSPPKDIPESRLKPIRRVVDKEPIFGREEIELSAWMASYYMCSHGEALSAMLPSGRRTGEYSSFTDDALEASAGEAALPLSPEQEAALQEIIKCRSS